MRVTISENVYVFVFFLVQEDDRPKVHFVILVGEVFVRRERSSLTEFYA